MILSHKGEGVNGKGTGGEVWKKTSGWMVSIMMDDPNSHKGEGVNGRGTGGEVWKKTSGWMVSIMMDDPLS